MWIVSGVVIAQLGLVVATAWVCVARPVAGPRGLSWAATVVAGVCVVGLSGIAVVVTTRPTEFDDPIRIIGAIYFWIAYVATLPWWAPAANELHGELTGRFGDDAAVVAIGLLPLLVHLSLAIGLRLLADWQAEHPSARRATWRGLRERRVSRRAHSA